MTTRPTTLPGQIPPQNAPLSYLDANGQQITDINWYLFLYRLWKEVVSSTGANALLLAQDALLMDPVSGGGGTGTGLTPIPDKTILANYTGVVALPTPFALNTIAAAINATNNWAKPQNVASATLIDGATITPNGDLSNNFYLLTTATVGASRAMAVPTGTIPTGAIINIEVEQPATGGPCAIVWAAGWKWGRGGQDPQSVGSAVASSVDSYSFQKQSNGNYHGVMIGQAGPTGAGYKATSLTSLVTGIGSRVFVTQAGLAYTAGARVRATSPSSGDYMEGVVATYAFSTLTVTMDRNSGTGTHTDWNINLAGDQGIGATVAVGTTSTGAAAVTNSGTSSAAVFNFTVPQGVAGPVGAPSNGVRLQSATSDTILVADNGKLVSNSNAGAIATTLPQATGSFTSPFVFDIENRGGGTLTVTPATSTIDGATNLALTANQGCRIFSDGANWYTQRGQTGAAGNTNPVFDVTNNALQTPASGVDTKVLFQTVSTDTNSAWSTTNHRYQPTVPGWYQLNATVRNNGALTGNSFLQFYKNGSLYRRQNSQAAGSTEWFGASILINLNGSTDYVELWIRITGTASIDFGSADTGFCGVWVRS